MKKVSLKKNFSWAFLGNLISAICQWAMLVALTKLSTVENVGVFGLAMAISTPVIMFTNLQLRSVYVTDVKEDYKFGEYLGLRLITVVLAFIIVLGIGLWRGYDLFTTLLLVIWCLAQCVISVKDSFMAIMQKNERMDLASHSRSIQSVLSLIFFVGMLYFSQSLLYAVCGVLLVRMFVLIFFDINFARIIFRASEDQSGDRVSLLPVFNFRRQISLLWLTFPLGVVMGLVSLNNNMPRYQIESMHSKEALGYFTALSSFVVTGNMMVVAVAQSVAPRLAKYYNENIRAFGRLLVKLFFVGLFIGLAGVLMAVLLGKPILAICFKPEYAQYNNVLVVIMISAVPYYITSFLNNGLMAARKLKIQVPLTLAALFAVWLAGYLLIPKYNQLGAAWAMFFGAMVTMIGTIILNFIEYRKKNVR